MRVKYNLDLLLKCCENDKANLSKKYDNLTGKTLIEFICSCGNIYNKVFRYIYENGGLFCKECSTKNKTQKIKNTCIEKYGVDNPLKNNDIKSKVEQTNIKKYGAKCCLINNEIKEKTILTNIKKYDSEHHMKSLLIQNKIKQTNNEKYGVDYSFQADVVKEKIKQTNNKKYGVDYSFQAEIVKEKIKNVMKEKYGCENPSQNEEIMNKKIINSFKRKQYIFPSGKIVFIQGYENLALDILLKEYNEDNIKITSKEVPKIIWKDNIQNNHIHFVDIFIENINKCIEVKSTWTFNIDTNNILLKQTYAKMKGFKYEIWIFNYKNILEKIID